MKKRFISGIFIILILIVALFNKNLFALLMSFCGVYGLYEFNKVRKNNKLIIIDIISYLSLLFIILNNVLYNVNIMSLLIITMLFLSIPIVIYNDKNKYNINDCVYRIFGIMLLGIAFNSLLNFRIDNIYLCIYVFLISFITDTYAYLGGMLIGKNKLTSISPKKTIEGSLVGTLMASVVGTIYFSAIMNSYNLYIVFIMCLLLSIISQFGDLFFSGIKRYFDIKDYSNLIPGHGGILDRLDSVIFVTLLLKVFMLF